MRKLLMIVLVALSLLAAGCSVGGPPDRSAVGTRDAAEAADGNAGTATPGTAPSGSEQAPQQAPSPEGEPPEFCAKFREAAQANTAQLEAAVAEIQAANAAFDPSNPEAALNGFGALARAFDPVFEAVGPYVPAELAASWPSFVEGFRAMATGDPSAVAADPSAAEANQKVGDFITQRCQVDLSAGLSGLTASDTTPTADPAGN